MTKKLEIKETPLPQDLAEGVDEDEWVGFICYYSSQLLFIEGPSSFTTTCAISAYHH